MLIYKTAGVPLTGILTTLSLLICVPSSARISLPVPAAECVRWAAADVETALKNAALPPAQAQIVVETEAPNSLPAEGFELQRRGNGVLLRGGDSVGTMYGLFELAEQIRNGRARGRWSTVLASLTDTTQRPFVEYRADNPFCQIKPLLLNDVPMWKDYIDMLARSRFNVLDLHGGYELQSTGFPNLYPLLVHVPEYPQVGKEDEQARNLADFKTIVAYAGSRGVKVAFMNYAADAPGVPHEQLADYTAKAVAILLRELPDLYMIGFRVGETGQKASFFQDAYLKGVTDSGRKDIRLYTRSWLTSKDQLQSIGQAYQGRFDIEIKYNGEQLGLPYQALQGGYGSYSYEDYLDLPAPYRIIWQVRANGTHRFWAWAQTEFIRRTVRTFRLGNARGFTLEPPIAYFNTRAAAYYKSVADQEVYRYIWQKDWMWYLTWGRLAYNPDLPEKTLKEAYLQRFGPSADAIYSAMQASGNIVPLVLSYRFQGPDHRDHSPETETGALSYHKSQGQGSLSPLTFGENTPMDHRSFVGIDTYVQERLGGKWDGRLSPKWVADYLSTAAMDARDSLDRVGAMDGPALEEWRLLKTDILSASHLADYYSDRIRGVMHLDYALRTGSEVDYNKAVDFLARSRTDWKALADTADAVYAPLLNKLRDQVGYQWISQLGQLEDLDKTVPELWAKRQSRSPGKPLDFPPESGSDLLVSNLHHALKGGNTITVSGIVSTPQRVRTLLLWSKPLPSEMKWVSQPVTLPPDGRWSVDLPLNPEGLLYAVEVQGVDGSARCFPDARVETPYVAITPAEIQASSSVR